MTGSVAQLPPLSTSAAGARADEATPWIRGTVEWFDAAKGFGFILPEDGGRPVFVEFSRIDLSGYRVLVEGQAVVYRTDRSCRGREAISVRPFTIAA